MDINAYDIVLGIAGLFFGQIAGRILIYRIIHPYIVAPYIKIKRERYVVMLNNK